MDINFHRAEEMVLEAHHEGVVVGSITIFERGELAFEPGFEVLDIEVEAPYRRNGIATALWNEMLKSFPTLQHSHAQSPDGKAWAATVPTE